jgi:hypothetical protein
MQKDEAVKSESSQGLAARRIRTKIPAHPKSTTSQSDR